MKRLLCIMMCVGPLACDDCSCLDNECAPDDDDTDTETDTDIGTDTETSDDCEWNSGQHCACDTPGELCSDGETVCAQVEGDEGDLGVCIYYTQTDECPDSPWGEPLLVINLAGGGMCFLGCDEDDDCPLDQSCISEPLVGNLMCYPS